jgi:hypothetical protein
LLFLVVDFLSSRDYNTYKKERRVVNAKLSKVYGGVILTILWICCFLFIRPTLVIDFGGGIIMNFKLLVVLLGLLIIIFYNIFYRSSTEITKLSLTVSYTIAWLALIIFFFPRTDQHSTYYGVVGFFTLVAGLGVCLVWTRYFADEISLEE